jgi:hypothetical protein
MLTLDELGRVAIRDQRDEIEADVGAGAFALIRALGVAKGTGEHATSQRLGAVACAKDEDHARHPPNWVGSLLVYRAKTCDDTSIPYHDDDQIKMKESQAVVQRVRRLDKNYQRIEIAIDSSLQTIKPGNALLARPKSMRQDRLWHPYLRTVWWPVDLKNQLVVVDRPTSERFEPGDVIDIIAPIGQPYRFRRSLHNVLLIAYDTDPSCLLLNIPWLVKNNIGVTLVLLGRAREYPFQSLPPQVEIALGEDDDKMLEWQSQVTSIGNADQAFVAVAPADEMASFQEIWTVFLKRRNDIGKNYLFGVFQNLLPCGVGACDACMIPTKDGFKLACVDGPAFDLATLPFIS